MQHLYSKDMTERYELLKDDMKPEAQEFVEQILRELYLIEEIIDKLTDGIEKEFQEKKLYKKIVETIIDQK